MPRLTVISPFGQAPAFIDLSRTAPKCQSHTPTFISPQTWAAGARIRRVALCKVASTSSSVTTRRGGGPPAPCTSACARPRLPWLICGSWCTAPEQPQTRQAPERAKKDRRRMPVSSSPWRTKWQSRALQKIALGDRQRPVIAADGAAQAGDVVAGGDLDQGRRRHPALGDGVGAARVE